MVDWKTTFNLKLRKLSYIKGFGFVISLRTAICKEVCDGRERKEGHQRNYDVTRHVCVNHSFSDKLL